MKKIHSASRFTLAIATLSVAALISILMYACTKPTQGIKVIVDSNSLFPAPTLLKFTNADSSSANQPGNFPVTISGPGAQYVQLAAGGTNFKTSNGLLSIALTKDANPSPSNPITFTVSATISGFAPILQNITITQNVLSVYSIKVFEYSTPAAGTTAVSGVTTPLNGGTLPSGYSITTPINATMSEQATLTFPAGTQMMDVNSAVITGNTLTLNIVQYGTGTDASLQALPGGLSAPTASKADNSQIVGGVNFVTAGVLQMNFYVNGTAVRHFSKPGTLSVELNNNLVNFATGAPIQIGDVIPVWSLNETTGQWTNESPATVYLDTKGKKAAQFQLTHLSCWNLDWSWGAFGAYGACGSALNVTVNTSDPTFKGGPYNITLETPSGQYLAGINGVTISNGYIAKFASSPAIPQTKIVVSGGIPYTKTESGLFNPCSAGTAQVTVPVATNNPVNVNIEIKAICNGKDVTVLPSATFELYQQTTGTTYVDAGTIQVVNGKGNTTLQVGKAYYFDTTYNGTDYKTGAFTVAKSNINIPSSGSGLTATAIYDATNNALNIAGSIPINCN